jgi:acetyl-CoA carboxylase biotin carboxylase subunit
VFASVLVANRGEIACRVVRTLRRLGIRSIAVHSDADAGARHVREADRAVRIGPPPAPSSYLDGEAIVAAARRTGAEAVHPGYGFLSESPSFARAVRDAGLAWIGPPPDVLELTGDKVAARRAFEALGFPVLPGAGPFRATVDAVEAGARIGYPLMVKAVMGGGGIGMGVARDEPALVAAVETASARAARSFGDAAVYVERFVAGARHVEVQVLADRGGTIHLYERECSVQRRHQKVIEETPSPALDPHASRAMCERAAAALAALGYRGAGTVECVLDPGGGFWFLEVNGRLQVEQAITEMTTGVDLVEEQLRVAAGSGSRLTAAPERRGHALECRVYAEDPRTFLPSPGTIRVLDLPPASDDLRLDFGYDGGDEVPMFYDPLLGKVIARAGDRAAAIATMRSALDALRVEGVKTNVPALLDALVDERFVSGAYDTALLGR